ncbi:CCT motif family protein [Trifolium repens]|nr:CCT motif family protein [Trifolium repens]
MSSDDIYTVDISFNQHYSTTDIISYDPSNFLDDFNNSFFSSFSPPNGTNNELETCHSTLMDSPNFQLCELSSPKNNFFSGQMRRPSSVGDLQIMKATNNHGSQMEESNFSKVGRYSMEERKEKISKYRAKRKQRKFNKIIKYACRKTLADNRTRIRGRFARNDNETNDISKTEQYHEDEFWVDLIEGLNDEHLY